MPGPGEIARGDEPVVAAAHDNDIGNRRCRLGWDAHESSAYPRVPLALAMQTPEHDLPMNLNTCVTAPIVPASLLPPVSCRSRPISRPGCWRCRTSRSPRPTCLPACGWGRAEHGARGDRD